MKASHRREPRCCSPRSRISSSSSTSRSSASRRLASSMIPPSSGSSAALISSTVRTGRTRTPARREPTCATILPRSSLPARPIRLLMTTAPSRRSCARRGAKRSSTSFAKACRTASISFPAYSSKATKPSRPSRRFSSRQAQLDGTKGEPAVDRGRAPLAFSLRCADIESGDWRWTSHSPTGSGPEGSSPNEVRIGSLVSLLPFLGESPKAAVFSLLSAKPAERHSIADRSMTDAGASSPRPDVGDQGGVDQRGFDLGPAPDAARPYRVLARKYRPASFEDLIGQDAVVRTVSNAFETGRIPQAWILTGVRGVGKTTTARILARALNYELPDGSVKAPTIHMPVLGVHCRAIMESRHMDVLEMDAASHTGVDDVRQINDSVRYAPASARYKVYIIDEVHMLSTAAFNAFLKTLEEPPEHAKFVFATTEIRKVPVTVLSRCQRFDLRRVEADVLMAHLSNIAKKEGVEIEPEALGIIARAAEGSVRDSLSLLDQAIAHAAGAVRADDVRQMLGLADRARVIDLFESLVRGDIAGAFREFREQYDTGADPIVVLSDLAEFVNFVTRVKVVPATADNVAFSETERLRARDFATKLSMRVLSRMWQMLLKGIAETQAATRPAAAAEMVLVRIAYAADLPTPDEAIRMIEQNGGASPIVAASSAQRPAPAPSPSAVAAPVRGSAAPRAE